MSVYKAILAVAGEMSKQGISKDGKNQQQGFKFRGIDQVFNALSPALVQHGLVILPRVLSCNVVERATKSGGAIFYTTLDVEYDFVSAEDGSKHTVRVVGEAMDSGDKSSNKAMSAAYKYACFQAFCIPTEGDNDADATTHEIAKKQINVAAETKAIDTLDSVASVKSAWALVSERCKAIPDPEAFELIKKFVTDKCSALTKDKQNVPANHV